MKNEEGKMKKEEQTMKPVKLRQIFPFLNFFLFSLFFFLLSCAASPSDNPAPAWLTALDRAYPSREWVAVTAEGQGQSQAELSAMNALARAFRTDVASLTRASQRFTQIIDNAAGSRTVTFNESENFRQDVNTTTNIKGLIGVQIDVYRAPGSTVYVCARMNRRECAARYSGMINENSRIINALLAAASPIQGTFDAYSRLSFAHAIAEVTDNFQNILEVLDSSAANRRPAYGGANAIKTKMLECAALITIGIAIDTEQQADRTLLTRAAGSFFRDMGFKVNEQGNGNYVLRANARFQTVTQNVISCRYYLDAALENTDRAAIFTFTEDDRKAHPNTESEARRLAVSAAETSFKEGKFAQEFDAWLNTLIE